MCRRHLQGPRAKGLVLSSVLLGGVGTFKMMSLVGLGWEGTGRRGWRSYFLRGLWETDFFSLLPVRSFFFFFLPHRSSHFIDSYSRGDNSKSRRWGLLGGSTWLQSPLTKACCPLPCLYLSLFTLCHEWAGLFYTIIICLLTDQKQRIRLARELWTRINLSSLEMISLRHIVIVTKTNKQTKNKTG